MSDCSGRLQLDKTIWSYSSVSSFDDCPYRWLLRNIRGEDGKRLYKDEDMFFSTYGSFIHEIIEGFYKGRYHRRDLVPTFLLGFGEKVRGEPPDGSFIQKYIKAGVDYLESFQPFNFDMLEVEKKIKFDLDGIPFVGVIDFLGERDGELCIIDNKSRNLKQRSSRAKPTVNDREIDSMLRQLYIYAAAVKQEYGKFPKWLCLNCFKNGNFIQEDFDMNAYNEAMVWVKETVGRIKSSTDFPATLDLDNPGKEWFKCSYICGVHKYCEYYENVKEKMKVRRRFGDKSRRN